MLDETTIKRVAGHEMIHRMGMCSCPCYDALMVVGEALKRETALRVKLAKVSPEALAVLTIGALPLDADEPDWPVDHAEGE